MLLALLLAACPAQQFCNTTGAPTAANLFTATSHGDEAWAAGQAGAVVHFDGREWSAIATPTQESFWHLVARGHDQPRLSRCLADVAAIRVAS